MDNDAFDAVLKRLSAGRMTRAAALRSLIGGGAAALVGARLALDTEAKGNKRHNKNKKRGNKNKSNGRVSSQATTCTCASGSTTLSYSGQGTFCDDSGCHLNSQICVDANGNPTGPYLLWVLTAKNAKTACLIIGGDSYSMTQKGKGAFQVQTPWYDLGNLQTLIAQGQVYACFDGTNVNPQLVISHGCPPQVATCQYSCTRGRYDQNQGNQDGCYPPGTSSSTIFPCNSALGLPATTTFGAILGGGSGVPACQHNAAAALLNLAWFGCYTLGNEVLQCPAGDLGSIACQTDVAAICVAATTSAGCTQLDAGNQHIPDDPTSGRCCPSNSCCGQADTNLPDFDQCIAGATCPA